MDDAAPEQRERADDDDNQVCDLESIESLSDPLEVGAPGADLTCTFRNE